MTIMNSRVALYNEISDKLSKLTDTEIFNLIEGGKKVHSGIGGISYKINLEGSEIFTKLVPLTELENQSENMYSTKNIFNLPLYYQYGVGSTGFGVWRELASTQACSDWVVSGVCNNFPILYNHIVLEDNNNLLKFERKNIEEHTDYWESNTAIRNRYSQILDARHMVVMFLEYIPYKLHDYLADIIVRDIDKAEKFTNKILYELIATCKFMSSHKMIHFDSHFHNVLTDGNDIYFADHGLALSKDFELTEKETEFFNVHNKLDQCFTIVNLLRCLTTSILGEDAWKDVLSAVEHKELNSYNLSDFVTNLIEQYGDMAVVMDKFYKDLKKSSKFTPYPSNELEQLLSQKQF